MAKRQTSPTVSSLAARVLGGYEPTRDEILRLAASCLSQDETKGEKQAEIPVSDAPAPQTEG